MFIIWNTLVVLIIFISIRIYLKRDNSDKFWIVMPINIITFGYLTISHLTYIVMNNGIAPTEHWNGYFTFVIVIIFLSLWGCLWEEDKFKKQYREERDKDKKIAKDS